MSHPSRGAWIEISIAQLFADLDDGRTPRGVRGLKSYESISISGRTGSHPSRGAWIEMEAFKLVGLRYRVAPLAGCVD